MNRRAFLAFIGAGALATLARGRATAGVLDGFTPGAALRWTKHRAAV